MTYGCNHQNKDMSKRRKDLGMKTLKIAGSLKTLSMIYLLSLTGLWRCVLRFPNLAACGKQYSSIDFLLATDIPYRCLDSHINYSRRRSSLLQSQQQDAKAKRSILISIASRASNGA